MNKKCTDFDKTVQHLYNCNILLQTYITVLNIRSSSGILSLTLTLKLSIALTILNLTIHDHNSKRKNSPLNEAHNTSPVCWPAAG